MRCCNLSLAATADAALVFVDAEAFVAFCALLFRLKLFLILLAAVVLAEEEVAVEVDKAALLDEAEVTEEDVLRIFCDPSKGQDHTQLNAQNIGLGQPVEISLTAQKEVQSSAMRISSKENVSLVLGWAKQCARTT